MKMKVPYFFSGFFLSVILLFSCSQNASELEGNFVYRNYFLRDSLFQTLDPTSHAKEIVELNEIPDSLIINWVRPLREKGLHNKMLSYQFQKDGHHLITIMLIDEIYDDKKSGEIDIQLSSQYALTVKDDGSFIDGLKVMESLSKDHLDDTFVGDMEIMSQFKWSKFVEDTIKVFDKTGYIKQTVISERSDYIEGPKGKELGILETILSEEFEGTDETVYLIDAAGKFRKLKEKKGDLTKMSENSGERIKVK